MPKATVIGGGFGGMAAALRLRARGYDVSLLDRCSRLGGRAQVLNVTVTAMMLDPPSLPHLFCLMSSSSYSVSGARIILILSRWMFGIDFIFTMAGNLITVER